MNDENKFNFRDSEKKIGESLKSVLTKVRQYYINNQATEALNDIGIMTTDDRGRSRLLHEIMDDLAERWNGLSSDTKDYVAISILGKSE